MKSPKVQLPLLAAFAIVSLLPVTGCQNNTQTGAALGAGAGSLAGAIIGHQTGHKGAGALIGGLAGGLTGAAIGNTQDVKNERDAAVTRASNMQANQRAAQRALSNSDLVTMTQNRVSDEIIINAIHTRGGRFRTNSEALISLQNSGVSQTVIMEAQRYSVD
jgi:outer membrane lipoprotein SlyB